MGKVALRVLAMMMVLSLGAATAFAASPGSGGNYVDADGDGICDYAGSVCSFADADGDGLCDSCGTAHLRGMAGAGCGGNLVDADGDGICDNLTDTDGDGVCDNSARGHGRGRGNGNGFRGGCRR